MKKYLIPLILLVILGACGTSSSLIEYEVLTPATYSVPPEVKSVVLVNNSYPFENKEAHVAIVNGHSQPLDSIINLGFPDSVLVSLKYTLEFEQFFDTVYYDTLRYNNKLTGVPMGELPKNKVFRICDKYGADAVLGLDAYTYGTELKVQETVEGTFSSMDVHGMSFWRLYDGKTGDILFKDLQKDTIFWYGDGESIEASIFRFPTIGQANNQFAFYVGEHFVDKIVPKWERVQRRFFDEGGVYFNAATDWIAKNNYEEARKIWAYIYEHGKLLDQARAAHNVAVSLEKDGDIVNAAQWAYNSYEKYHEVTGSMHEDEVSDSEKYYIYLTHRIKEVEKLKIQVGEL